MAKHKGIRHGDLLLFEVDMLPEGLKEAKINVIMSGSNGNPHSFKGGHFYLKNVDQFTFGYLDAREGTTLFHVEHGKRVAGKKLREVSLKKVIYATRRQVEDTHQGMRPVVD